MDALAPGPERLWVVGLLRAVSAGWVLCLCGDLGGLGSRPGGWGAWLWVRVLCPGSGESLVQHGLIMPMISGATDGATSIGIPYCGRGHLCRNPATN